MKFNTYVESKSKKINLSEAARRAGTTVPKFRRYLMRLQLPVERSGRIVLVDESVITRVKSILESEPLATGRPSVKKEA